MFRSFAGRSSPLQQLLRHQAGQVRLFTKLWRRVKSTLPQVGEPRPEFMVLEGPTQRQKLVLWGMMGINLSVFLKWNSIDSIDQKRKMADHWTTNVRNTLERPWTLITAAFSHSVPLHFAFNMVAFNSFAPILIELLAVRQFLSFYLSASAVASLSHAAYCLATRTDTPALGASGAVSSMMVMVAILFPSAKFLIFGIFPCPAIVCVAGFATYEIFYLGDNSGVGRAAHLGGLAFGVLYYFRRIRIRL